MGTWVLINGIWYNTLRAPATARVPDLETAFLEMMR
jgi:hypothetical protein